MISAVRYCDAVDSLDQLSISSSQNDAAEDSTALGCDRSVES
jgi:hypothetical protein